MSCGTKLEGRFYSYSEREELADHLRERGEYNLADKVKRQECLGFSELRRAENVLSDAGMTRYHDYKEERCHCADEDEYER